MNLAARTHVGMIRQRNEDSHYVGEYLVVVADGMGGHVAGDVASRIVVAALTAFDRATPTTGLGATLAVAVDAANRALQQHISGTPEVAGMGTTLVAALWNGDDVAIANVGDSRIYLHRAGRLQPLTDDHVYSRLVSNAATVPNLGERITRFLDGRIDGRSPDITLLRLQRGDQLLLCSDGLSSYVPEETIEGILGSGRVPEEAADELVAAALAQGGPDNVTVIVADA